MSAAVRCGRCGIRYHSRYEKCPRCRSRDPRPIERAAGQRSPRAAAGQGARRGQPEAVPGRGLHVKPGAFASVAAGIILLLTGWVWGPAFSAGVPASAPDSSGPLAALMRASQPRRSTPPERVPTELPFIDAATAGTLAYSRGELEQALGMFEKEIVNRPSDAESHSNAAQVLIRLGRPTDALPLLERAVALNESRWAYRFNLARCRGLLGDWTGAVSDYRAAAELFPADYATLFNLAQSLHRAGREEEAVAGYREAIAAKPDDATFHLALGISEENRGQAAAAVAAYREFLQMAPEAAEAAGVRTRLEQLQPMAAAAATTSATPSAADAAGQ